MSKVAKLTRRLFLMLVLACSAPVGAEVMTDRPGDYTRLDAERNLKAIKGALPIYDPATKKFTPDQPPSKSLKNAVKALLPAWKILYDARDRHDILPPSRTEVLKRCADLIKFMSGPIKTKYLLKKELFELEKRERFVEKARQQTTHRNWTKVVFTGVKALKYIYDKFKLILSPTPQDVADLFEEIVKEMVKSSLNSKVQNPAMLAISQASKKQLGEKGFKYFVENKREILDVANKYIKKRKFLPHELRNPEKVIGEVFNVIREYLKNRGQKGAEWRQGAAQGAWNSGADQKDQKRATQNYNREAAVGGV